MRPSATARRYAEAAFQVAQENGEVDGWMQDLREAVEALQDSELSDYFRDPAIATDDKMQTLETGFRRLHPHVLNLLRILLTRYRLHLLPAILAVFAELEHQAQGVTEADVTVARSIDDKERASIAAQLGQILGKKVEIRAQVDPNILGGVVIRIGDKLIDASVAGRLQRLRQEMAV